MRQISTRTIIDRIKDSAMRLNFELKEDVLSSLKDALDNEESQVGKEILNQLIENAGIARHDMIPICQDTGLAIIIAEMGQEVCIVGGDLRSAFEEGIRQGYKEGYLRNSVCHPFTRENTGDNTPIIVHFDMVPGDRLKLWFAAKGGGSENMSRLFMLPPSAGWVGVKEKIVQTVEEAGPNPCPPTIIGVGIGGSFEQSALLAQKALFRPLGTLNPDSELVKMEDEVLEEINKTGIGPQGLGGRITSLAVHILMMPCHISSLPLAIDIQCHASRYTEIIF
ncbi:MAG: fumarate hydratase [Deltaproteobacteria bacterium]|nr:fumarate hydratase [Deltaproteobacteria bacterium]